MKILCKCDVTIERGTIIKQSWKNKDLQVLDEIFFFTPAITEMGDDCSQLKTEVFHRLMVSYEEAFYCAEIKEQKIKSVSIAGLANSKWSVE